jgi:hypothetical protein
MQEPSEEAVDSISTTENNEREDPDLNRTFALRRKASKRTLPWDLVGEELNLISRRQESRDVRAATKKARLEEPFSASTDEAAAERSSHDTAINLPAAADDDEDADPKKGSRATGHWSPEEDVDLNSAVMNTCKKKHGKESRTDWVAISILVPGRTQRQCYNRWRRVLDPSIDRANERLGRWTEDEVIKLKDAAQIHGGKNWDAIALLVPGRTIIQCSSRWHKAADPNIDQANERMGTWAQDEDSKLKDAVQTHGGKNWCAIAALVSGRGEKQCCNRWNHALNPSIGLASARSGKWTEDEDIKLKDAVQAHGSKNWEAIAALVPGRTRGQCYDRWKDVLDPSIDRESGRTGKWTEDESSKLKDAVQLHGGKNWNAIAALVPGRTRIQCRSRWRDNPNIDQVIGHACKWTAVEDIKLKDAVQMCGDKDWGAINARVPGRTRGQCRDRWRKVVDPSIALTAGSTGKWTAVEDVKLKDAVQTHGSKNWEAIAALVPGRTKMQCYDRWKDTLDPKIDRVNARTGKWAEDEDIKLKDAVETHGGKNWDKIAALVPGRTQRQCCNRWQFVRRSLKREQDRGAP